MNAYLVQSVGESSIVLALSFTEAVSAFLGWVNSPAAGDAEPDWTEEDIESVHLLGEVKNWPYYVEPSAPPQAPEGGDGP